MKKSLSLILTALCIILLLAGCTGNNEDSTEKPTGEPTQTPTGDNNADNPNETPDENHEQKPDENPDKTPDNKPDETPDITGDNTLDDKPPEGVKYLRSDTGTQLNMLLEYDTAKNENGSYTVDVTLKLECYSLNVTARSNANYVKIGDENFYFSTDAINYSGKEKTTFTLATHKFEVNDESEKIPVYAIWYFNGTYNDKPVAAVVIDGEITLE